LSYRADPRDGNLFKRLGKRLFLLRACRRYLKLNKPDLIHVHDESSALAWGIAARPFKIPMIWHVHQQLPQKYVDWLILRLSRFVIFVSDANRVRFDGKPLPASETVYNSVNLDRFKPADSDVEERPLVVGFVSNLVKRKRPDWVVRAVGALVRSGLNVRLAVAGNDFTGGQAEADLRALAEQEGLAGRYDYLGFQSDIPGLLRTIDILALPSERDREAFPRIVVEALASGVPVVATRVAGIPEGVTDGYNGRLTDPDDFPAFRDALHELCSNEETRKLYAANARKHAEKHFSATAMGGQLREIYDIVLKSSVR
jgi:glycosyltransferase involved in cell wall biosynthesis